MSESSTANSGQRDRSPAYPVIPLGTALERLAEFETHFKRSSARPEKVGDAWGIKAKAYADRITAALRYFGLLEYQANNGFRSIVVSELGRNYLRAQQDRVKQDIIQSIALKPKQIAIFWNQWGADRPADAACLDELVLNNGFSEAGARDFLKIYDATIAFAKPKEGDKIGAHEVIDDEETGAATLGQAPPSPPIRHQPQGRHVHIMTGERVAFAEEGQPGQYLKLIASGDMDDFLLEALEDFVKRQRRRIKSTTPPTMADPNAEE